jgi:hypothetical protein
MPGDENHIPTRSYQSLFQPQSDCLSHLALEPIAFHAITDAPTNRETKPAVAQIVW